MAMVNKNIKYLRKRNNLSQEDFGKLFKLTRGQVASYEASIEPSLSTLMEITDHFDLDLYKFVSIEMVNGIDIFKKRGGTQEEEFSIPEDENIEVAVLLRKYQKATSQDRVKMFQDLAKEMMNQRQDNHSLKDKVIQLHEAKDALAQELKDIISR